MNAEVDTNTITFNEVIITTTYSGTTGNPITTDYSNIHITTTSIDTTFIT